ncbi:hypothetical protein SP19_107 [Salmonella phage 19]|nr:hypothetical protein SP19_107 [Salmonella phage 19]
MELLPSDLLDKALSKIRTVQLVTLPDSYGASAPEDLLRG